MGLFSQIDNASWNIRFQNPDMIFIVRVLWRIQGTVHLKVWQSFWTVRPSRRGREEGSTKWCCPWCKPIHTWENTSVSHPTWEQQKKTSNIEWDLTNGPLKKLLELLVRYSGFFLCVQCVQLEFFLEKACFIDFGGGMGDTCTAQDYLWGKLCWGT